MIKFLEIILIVLILRSVLSMALPFLRRKSRPIPTASKKDRDPFRKKADIIDGEFEDLK
jgi:hypothetical protein